MVGNKAVKFYRQMLALQFLNSMKMKIKLSILPTFLLLIIGVIAATATVTGWAAAKNELSLHSATAPATNNASLPLLVWLVVLAKDPQQNVLLDDSHNNRLTRELKTAAKTAGLDVILPTMDLEDISKITPDDICNFDVKIITAAAQRYGAKNVLVGCIAAGMDNGVSSERNGSYSDGTVSDIKHSEWTLLAKGKKTAHWKLTAAGNAMLIRQAINEVGQIITPINPSSTISAVPVLPLASANSPLPTPTATSSSPSFVAASVSTPTATVASVVTPRTAVSTAGSVPSSVAASSATNASNPLNTTNAANAASATNVSSATMPTMVGNASNSAVLRVSDVTSLEQYATVAKYLHTLPQVKRIELFNISTTTVSFSVIINGGKNALLNVLKAQTQLAPDMPSFAGELNYKWMQKKP